MRKLLVLAAAFAAVAAWGGAQGRQMNEMPPATVTKTYKDATGLGESNITQWNSKDWENRVGNYRSREGRIGDTQSAVSGTANGQAAMTSDPSKLTRDYVMSDPTLSKIESNKAFDTAQRNAVINTAVGNNYLSVNDEDRKIRCYITRDFPFQYRCERTGVVYGGGMDEGGAAARRECESNCYEQYSCVNAAYGASAASAAALSEFRIRNGKVSDSTPRSLRLNSTVPAGYLSLSISSDLQNAGRTSEPFPYDVTVTIRRPDGTTYKLIDKMRLRGDEKNVRLYVGHPIVSAETRLSVVPGSFPASASGDVRIELKAEQPTNQQWLCPQVQDIKGLNPGQFAYKCPSGNIVTIRAGNQTYKICADGNHYGDNRNGTFSSLERCNSICKKTYACRPVGTAPNANQLETFREGCIQGQIDCTDQACRDARILGAKVIDEIVFDASQNHRKTVVNGTQVAGAERPKVTLRTDIDFMERSKEEWKDKAYNAMVEAGTYNMTDRTLGEDTDVETAWGVGLSGAVDAGVEGAASRTLYLKLKPNAFSVNNDAPSYIYALFRVAVDYVGYDTEGKEVVKRDEIWYFKTSEEDTFGAYRRTYDYAVVTGEGPNGTSIAINAYAKPKNVRFNGSSWVTVSTSTLAPYFKSDSFSEAKVFWMFPLVKEMGNLINTLPGIAHRRSSYDGGATRYYTGPRDDTAESIAKVRVYAYISPTRLTLQQVYDRLEAGEMPLVYESVNPNATPRDLGGDGRLKEGTVRIFTYGRADKKSAFAIIKPRKEDVGKKAFIFVFAR